MSGALYLDSSATAKLALAERESEPLAAEVRDRQWIASALTVTETTRVLRRHGVHAPALLDELERVALLPVDEDVLATAAGIEPPTLGTLDAIHLATVLLARDDIDALVTYDRRLAAAAEAHGVQVLSPA